jgi:hypothetical protein
MRSELVFHALRGTSNRYLLVRLVSKATRLLHRPNTRIQDTTNDALDDVAVRPMSAENEMAVRTAAEDSRKA